MPLTCQLKKNKKMLKSQKKFDFNIKTKTYIICDIIITAAVF